MNISEAIAVLEKTVENPNKGLPQELFLYASKITPLVNVDLLVKDESGRTLLSWRNDKYAGTGWHVPGGILRYKETLENRVIEVSRSEIGTSVRFDSLPIAVNQLIHPRHEVRGHFISFLYKCFLPGSFIPENAGLSRDDAGFLMWHDRCPENLIEVHELYRKYIDLN